MIAKWLLQNLIWVVVLGVLLFVPAGTLHWPAAWVFLGASAVIGIGCGWWLAKTDPALLAERMRPMMQKDQPAADKKFMLVFGVTALICFLRSDSTSACMLPIFLSPCRRWDWRCCC
jgi:uncharacterized membrane protein YfcA